MYLKIVIEYEYEYNYKGKGIYLFIYLFQKTWRQGYVALLRREQQN